MRDVTHLYQIVENDLICLDNNDRISVRLWVSQLQQDSAGVVLKDRLDLPPPDSGLSANTFVLCIQTEFQTDHFRALGSGFVSIDGTHNTTQYAGMQLFMLLVRDQWGHGALCGIFPFVDNSLMPLYRGSYCVDAVVKWHRSNYQIFPQFHKIMEPRDQAHDYHE